MVQTASIGKKIYSVDMMFAYINLKKPKFSYARVKDLEKNLEFAGWGDPIKKKFHSPLDVIKNPAKYKSDMRRIKKADLNYPICIFAGDVIDGVHRLAKAVLEKQEKIKVYSFTPALMQKFLIDSSGDFKKTDKMETWQFIELFAKRF